MATVSSKHRPTKGLLCFGSHAVVHTANPWLQVSWSILHLEGVSNASQTEQSSLSVSLPIGEEQLDNIITI